MYLIPTCSLLAPLIIKSTDRLFIGVSENSCVYVLLFCERVLSLW